MTALRSLMTADAADGGTFFPTSGGAAIGFNELATFYPAYSEANKVTNVNCVVVEDNLEGSREARGDGIADFSRREGRRTRRTITIECAASLAVRDRQPMKTPDAFKIGSDVWIVKRIMGKDDDLQTVLCVLQEDTSIRTESRTG